MTNLVPGREVTFRRIETPTIPATPTATPAPDEGDDVAAEGQVPTLLLVACVKEKLTVPAAARDLYVSPLFKKEREYAERAGLPWFILSAEHGLVVPDEWLSPYERYLPDTPPSFRRAWGTWVIERLELLTGSLDGRTIEVHAGATYVDALRGALASKGASVFEPLAGLGMGQRLAWYGARPCRTDERDMPMDLHAAADEFCERLTDDSAAVNPGVFIARGPSDLRVPGSTAGGSTPRERSICQRAWGCPWTRGSSTPASRARPAGPAVDRPPTPCGHGSPGCTWAAGTSSRPSDGPSAPSWPTPATRRRSTKPDRQRGCTTTYK